MKVKDTGTSGLQLRMVSICLSLLVCRNGHDSGAMSYAEAKLECIL